MTTTTLTMNAFASKSTFLPPPFVQLNSVSNPQLPTYLTMTFLTI